MAKNPRFIIFLAGVFFLAGAACAKAQESKGALIAQGQYFSVYSDIPGGANEIASKLNFNYFIFGDKLLKGTDDDPRVILGKTVDGIFLEVADVIDIHLYSFKGAICVVADKQALSDLIKQKFGFDFSERSLYCFEENTIYISGQDINTGMLGHEIAHAIISNFFVVPPPPKVQEIISGYVEYSLNKARAS